MFHSFQTPNQTKPKQRLYSYFTTVTVLQLIPGQLSRFIGGWGCFFPVLQNCQFSRQWFIAYGQWTHFTQFCNAKSDFLENATTLQPHDLGVGSKFQGWSLSRHYFAMHFSDLWLFAIAVKQLLNLWFFLRTIKKLEFQTEMHTSL